MKRVMLSCVAVMFLFGISSGSFAAGMGEEMKGGAETMKEEGMKKGEEAMGDMKGKGEEMSTKGKEKSGKIDAQGKEKKAKAKKKETK